MSSGRSRQEGQWRLPRRRGCGSSGIRGGMTESAGDLAQGRPVLGATRRVRQSYRARAPGETLRAVKAVGHQRVGEPVVADEPGR